MIIHNPKSERLPSTCGISKIASDGWSVRGVSEDIPGAGTYRGWVQRGAFCSDRKRNIKFITEIVSA